MAGDLLEAAGTLLMRREIAAFQGTHGRMGKVKLPDPVTQR